MTQEDKRQKKFLILIQQLAPAQFVALCRLLKVKIFTKEWDKDTKKAECRDAKNLVADLLQKFIELPQSDKKFVLRLLRKEVRDGTTTKNRE